MKGTGRWIAAINLTAVLMALASGIFMTGVACIRGGAPDYVPIPHMFETFPGERRIGMGVMWLVLIGVVALVVWAAATLANGRRT